MENNNYRNSVMKYILICMMLFGVAFGQTQPSLPAGTIPYSGNLFISTDGLIWTGKAGSYTNIGSKADYDALVSAGYTNAQIDSIALDVYTRARARANHTGTQAISTVSGLQAALDAKQATITGGASTITTANLTANRALVSDAAGKVAVSAVTSTQLGYLTGVTSAIQTQLNNKINSSEKGAVNGVATLGADGKLPAGQLPSIAITETFVVSSQAQMLALAAEIGDVAVRNDIDKSFILQASPASTLANWIELLSPSVDNTDQIPEGSTNLYFTQARARASLSAGTGVGYNSSTGVISNTSPNLPSNLAVGSRTTTTVPITNSDGTGVTIPVSSTTLAGVMSSTDKVKLDGIATGATANSTDAQLRDRATHTGVQAISTVTGLQTALDSKEALANKATSLVSANNTTYPTTLAVSNAITAATPAPQTLSLGTNPGSVNISGGNSVTLRDISIHPPEDFQDANVIPSTPGLFPYQISTGSLNYPTTTGAGIKVSRGFGNGYFEIHKPVFGNDDLYFRSGINVNTLGAWKIFADRDWVSTQLPTVNNGTLTMSTGTGLNGSSSFTANQSGNSTFSVGVDALGVEEVSTGKVMTSGYLGIGVNGLSRGSAIPPKDQLSNLGVYTYGQGFLGDDTVPITSAFKMLNVGHTAWSSQLLFNSYQNEMWLRSRTSSNGAFRPWTKIASEDYVNSQIPAPQTLTAQPSGTGSISISSGNTVLLSSLRPTNFPDANTNPFSSSGLTISTNTTGSTNWPATLGGGLSYHRTGDSNNLGAFQLWKTSNSDNVLRFRGGSGTDTWNPWVVLADREWTSLNYVDLTTSQSVGGIKTFTNNPVVRPSTASSAILDLRGNDTGDGSSYVRFLGKATSTQIGYVGKGSPTLNDIIINNSLTNSSLRLSGSSPLASIFTDNVSRLAISTANIAMTLNLIGTTATFSGNISATTAPTIGDHLTNKTYVDTKLSISDVTPNGLGMNSAASTGAGLIPVFNGSLNSFFPALRYSAGNIDPGYLVARESTIGSILLPTPTAAAHGANKGYVDAQSVIESLDEGNGIGYRLRSSNPAYFGNIGLGAIDFSRSVAASTTYGATGISSFAAGYNSTASGTSSVALGENNISSGQGSVSTGNTNSATGASSATIGGLNNTAEHDQSVTLGGQGLLSGNTNQAIIGRYNSPSISSVLIVGNGTSNSIRSNSFEVLSGSAGVMMSGVATAGQFKVSSLNTAPASATASGSTGEIRITSTHIYVCIATNTWVRSALTTW